MERVGSIIKRLYRFYKIVGYYPSNKKIEKAGDSRFPAFSAKFPGRAHEPLLDAIVRTDPKWGSGKTKNESKKEVKRV